MVGSAPLRLHRAEEHFGDGVGDVDDGSSEVVVQAVAFVEPSPAVGAALVEGPYQAETVPVRVEEAYVVIEA